MRLSFFVLSGRGHFPPRATLGSFPQSYRGPVRSFPEMSIGPGRAVSLFVLNLGSFLQFTWEIDVMPRKFSKRVGETNGHALGTLPEVSDQAVRELAQVFKLLSDETRLRILLYLAQSPTSELHVTDLCSRLGQSQPAVSHHLALLRVSGLIESRREGKHNFYSVRTDHFGELLISLFSAAGDMPRKIRFHDFTLAYSGE
jgi:ArsR family transcriptional regulator